MTAQLIDRATGNTYRPLTRVAKDSTAQMFIWQQAPRLWRFVVWELEDCRVYVTGPQMQTKRDALDRAEHVATSLGDFRQEAICI